MNNGHILIVEDEQKIATLLQEYLRSEGFTTTVLKQGNLVMPYLQQHQLELVLLDLMLPGKDGITLCKEIRAFSNIPVIMVTAKIEEIDRLLGLELGADDYICKPFSPREVVARIKAVLRRYRVVEKKQLLENGSIKIDLDSREVTVAGQLVKLTPIEFGILKEFLQNPGRVFSRNDLLTKVMGYDFEGYDRTIDSHIKNLRKKLSVISGDSELIQSIYGIGYKLANFQKN